MLNASLGSIGVWLAFVTSIVGAVTIAVGLVRQKGAGSSPSGSVPRSSARYARLFEGRLFAPIMLIGAVLAVLAMERALVTHDFSIVFVAENNSTVTPLLYSITGLWSALAGSILLWGFVLTVFCSIFVWRYRAVASDAVIRWATLVLFVVTAFFFGLMIGPANPFVTTRNVLSGLGPNSLLQDNPLVAIHPPLLYIGFVGFTVPFAFAIGMLATGRIGDRWQIECRRWTLVSFTFLSVGIVLGAWWSYQVLGWGGFWGWDPVENAALLPWLCGTAYLHSVLVQERRGLMRVWNLSLSVATFALTILGTFLTRSGVIQSVHAFSESSIGPLLIGFFFVVVIVGFGLIAWRGDRLRSPGWDRCTARPRGSVPSQQPALRRLRLRRAARNAVPDPLRGGDAAAGERGGAVLQHGRRSRGPGPPFPDGGGSGVELAQDQRTRSCGNAWPFRPGSVS